ncbi:MAG TPA: hypothetical protein PKA95_01835 [Thermomicrobiales bacterium]|nr:hypothetical protein [Thermomicrobiales bacterium]
MSPHTERQRPDADEADSRYVYREDDADVRTIIWASVWTLFGFKVVTSILILVVFPTVDALAVVIALSVPWFVAALMYYGFFGKLRVRLLRARARRRKLIYQEWNVD